MMRNYKIESATFKMWNSLLIFYFLVLSGGILFLQVGCEQEARATSVPEAEPTARRPMVRSEDIQTVSDVNGPAPRIVFEKVVNDFGEIGPRTKNTCEFNFKNEGDGVLKITNVSKTCGCTPYTLSKKEYVPGESGVLKVKYNASSHAGTASKRLFVSSNDRQQPKITLTIKAKIVLKVDYEPKKLSLSLKGKNAGCPDIVIKSIDGQLFAVKKFESTGKCITADVDSSVKAKEFVLHPEVDMGKLQKSSNGRISIELTHPGTSTISIPFEVLSRFKVSPPVITVLKAEPQESITRKIWILNNYQEDFEIESTASEKGTIRVLSQKKVKDGYEIELDVTPPAVEDKERFFSDEFLVNIKDGEKLKITCRGFYSRKGKS